MIDLRARRGSLFGALALLAGVLLWTGCARQTTETELESDLFAAYGVELPQGQNPESVIRALLDRGDGAQTAATVTIDYPLEGSLFPPELVAPTFLWHDPVDEVGLWLIDRLGRKTLLYIGSFGYIASLGLCAWAFFTETYAIVPACIFAFIAAHAVGQGAVIWVFISEIFPNDHRAAGTALGSATHWICAAGMTSLFPIVVGSVETGYIFGFFCFMMVLQLLWVKFLVPETKGITLEDMQKKLGIE